MTATRRPNRTGEVSHCDCLGVLALHRLESSGLAPLVPLQGIANWYGRISHVTRQQMIEEIGHSVALVQYGLGLPSCAVCK